MVVPIYPGVWLPDKEWELILAKQHIRMLKFYSERYPEGPATLVLEAMNK